MYTKEEHDEIMNNPMISDESKRNYFKGEDLLKKGEYENALLCFNYVINQDNSFLQAYRGKYFSIKEILKTNNEKGLIKQAIGCLDKCIVLSPTEIKYYHLKADLFSECKKYDKAIMVLLQVVAADIHMPDDLCNIADWYHKLYRNDKAEYYYKMALNRVPFYYNKIIDTEFNPTGKKKSLKIKYRPKARYYEVTYIENDIHARISLLYNEIGYYSKALWEINEAINGSGWTKYELYKGNILNNIRKKFKTNIYNQEMKKCLERYYKYSLCDDNETKHTILYSLIKSESCLSREINWSAFPLLFIDNPQSILDIFCSNTQIQDVSNANITQYYKQVLLIEDFLQLMLYYSVEDTRKNAMRKNAIIRFYLGGIASSYYIFDEFLDNDCNELNAMELFYYSKTAQIINLEFDSINNYNIETLKISNNDYISNYYLGHLYLLQGDKNKALNYFDKSKDFPFSQIMVSFLKEETLSDVPILMGSIDKFSKIKIDLNNDGLSQFTEYFHLIECGEAIEYLFPNNQIAMQFINTPIWEIFYLDTDTKDIVKKKLKSNSIEKILKLLLTSEKYENELDNLNELKQSIDKQVDIVLTLSSLCRGKEIDRKSLLSLTLYYYSCNKIGLEDFICLNLYLRVCSLKNSKKIITYCIFSSLSLIDNRLGLLLDILFYILDNTSILESRHKSYAVFKSDIRNRLFEDCNYDKIINLVKIISE